MLCEWDQSHTLIYTDLEIVINDAVHCKTGFENTKIWYDVAHLAQ